MRVSPSSICSGVISQYLFTSNFVRILLVVSSIITESVARTMTTSALSFML